MAKPKSKSLPSPVASDDVTTKADFVELLALRADDGNASLQDLVVELRRSGSVDGYGDPDSNDDLLADRGGQTCQVLAEEAFGELEDRHSSCGGVQTQQYPFEVENRLLACRQNVEAAGQVYTFLLLLSRFGTNAGPKGTHGERIFEDLCRHAAEGYFGGKSSGARAELFGFPRRILPRHFPNALRELSSRMGDFTANEKAPKSKDQKDAKLDIVAWKHFPDRRPGKLIGFGQCAAGQSNLDTKIHELQVSSFCKSWLSDHPSVDPIRMFFVPWRIDSSDFRKKCIDGGIVFDRCRISYFCSDLDQQVRNQCRQWTTHVLKTAVSA